MIEIQELADMPVWDKTGILKLLGKKPERLSGLTSLFVSNIPSIVELLIQAIDVADFEAIENEAHNIRGAAANLGGMRVQYITQKIESAAKSEQQEYITSLKPLFTQHIDEFIEQIKLA